MRICMLKDRIGIVGRPEVFAIHAEGLLVAGLPEWQQPSRRIARIRSHDRLYELPWKKNIDPDHRKTARRAGNEMSELGHKRERRPRRRPASHAAGVPQLADSRLAGREESALGQGETSRPFRPLAQITGGA